MYNELYDVWQKENGADELTELPSDFYARIVEYLRLLRQEGRMLDKRTVKARLLTTERMKVERMIRGIFFVRYRKLIQKVSSGNEIAQHVLSSEEDKLRSHCLPAIEEHRVLGRNLVRGRLSAGDVGRNRLIVLRFLKEVPQIIGADLKAYGPYKTEDVASLPAENGDVLIKQKYAEKVEVS